MTHLSAISLWEIWKDTPKPQKHRSLNCKVYDIEYKISNPDRVILLVKCNESYSNDSGWIVSIRFDGYKPKKRDIKKPINTDMRLHCSCPAFQFWGSAYIATMEDYNYDFSENRFPIVRDPELKNLVCKHIIAVVHRFKGETFKKLMKKYAVKDDEYNKRIEETKQNRKRRTSTAKVIKAHDLIKTDGTVSVEEVIPVVNKYIKANQLPIVDFGNINSLNFERVISKIEGLII